VIGRDRDLLRQVAAAGIAAWLREAVRDPLAVDDRMAVDDLQRVARRGDDALDEVRVGGLVDRLGTCLARGQRLDPAGLGRIGALRRMEDDDVADLGIAEVVADPLDEVGIIEPVGIW